MNKYQAQYRQMRKQKRISLIKKMSTEPEQMPELLPPDLAEVLNKCNRSLNPRNNLDEVKEIEPRRKKFIPNILLRANKQKLLLLKPDLADDRNSSCTSVCNESQEGTTIIFKEMEPLEYIIPDVNLFTALNTESEVEPIENSEIPPTTSDDNPCINSTGDTEDSLDLDHVSAVDLMNDWKEMLALDSSQLQPIVVLHDIKNVLKSSGNIIDLKLLNLNKGRSLLKRSSPEALSVKAEMESSTSVVSAQEKSQGTNFGNNYPDEEEQKMQSALNEVEIGHSLMGTAVKYEICRYTLEQKYNSYLREKAAAQKKEIEFNEKPVFIRAFNDIKAGNSILDVANKYNIVIETLESKFNSCVTALEEEMAYYDSAESNLTQFKILQRNILYQLQSILAHSTALPFKWNGRSFSCAFCDETADNLQKLKSHTNIYHTHEWVSSVQTLFKSSDEIIRLDLTDLTCMTCQRKISGHQLFDHFTDVHKVVLHDSRKRFFLYSLLENKCLMCEREFESFKALDEHMFTHFPIVICKCGKNFLTNVGLRRHMIVHCAEAAYKCSRCSKRFYYEHFKRYHSRIVHEKKPYFDVTKYKIQEQRKKSEKIGNFKRSKQKEPQNSRDGNKQKATKNATKDVNKTATINKESKKLYIEINNSGFEESIETDIKIERMDTDDSEESTDSANTDDPEITADTQDDLCCSTVGIAEEIEIKTEIQDDFFVEYPEDNYNGTDIDIKEELTTF